MLPQISAPHPTLQLTKPPTPAVVANGETNLPLLAKVPDISTTYPVQVAVAGAVRPRTTREIYSTRLRFHLGFFSFFSFNVFPSSSSFIIQQPDDQPEVLQQFNIFFFVFPLFCSHTSLLFTSVTLLRLPVPEFIDPIFTKTSPKRSFSRVFATTGFIISGTRLA